MSGVHKFVNVEGAPDGGPYACPCCGFVTLPERGGCEICPVCFWKDDGQTTMMPTPFEAARTDGSSCAE